MDVLKYFKETNASVVCLQDTHLIDKDISSVRKIWPECYMQLATWILLQFYSTKISLLNIYAQNDDEQVFFEEI